MNHLLFADELVAYCKCGSSQQVLQHGFFSTHLIDFLLHATRQERKSALKVRGTVSLKTPKAVYSVSDRKYTAAGGDVQVPWGGIRE